MVSQAKELSLFSETEFEFRAPPNGGFPVSCPTLDLSTIWDSEGRNLLIYRPPGQVVSKIHQVGVAGEKAPEPCAVTWKPDGQFLSIGWNDGILRLMGLENNKAAHHIPVCDKSGAIITHIGWSTNTLAPSTRRSISTKLKVELDKESSQSKKKAFLDLPKELTFLEVETALPKLSPLPTSSAGAGEDATVFTLRSGIDFLFQPPQKGTYDQVDIMIVGTNDGRLQLSIYDSFVIGSFPSPLPTFPVSRHMIHHASNTLLSTHALIYAQTRDEPEEIFLVPMDLPFVSFSPINLSLLSSKLTTLQALLRYLKQTSLHMQVEWKNARELPSRFLRSVQGDLEELASGPKDVVSALCHTVLTGHAHGPVREWLIDSVAERGHKRWDKAVVSGLEGLRTLVHQHFLPALERCSIILSRLRGLARFYDHREDIGFSISHINRVLDILSCLTLVGHKILNHTMDELQHFAAFSTWLRFQIDNIAAPSTAGEELAEKEATMDHPKILTYIDRYLNRSPLDIFFNDIAKEDYTADWNFIEDGPTLLDVLDKQLKKHAASEEGMKALPHVEFLLNYASTWSSKIFSGIAEAKRRSVRFGDSIRLFINQPITKIEFKMYCSDLNHGIIFTALASRIEPSKVYLFNVGINIINGISDNQLVKRCCIDLSARTLIDMKFLDDNTLILLCYDSNKSPILLFLPIQDIDESCYSVCDTSDPQEPSSSLVLDHMFDKFALPTNHQTLRPVRMEVHGRSDVRGNVPTRISLLGSNRTTWRTFTIPSRS